jgi:hypothetical protein
MARRGRPSRFLVAFSSMATWPDRPPEQLLSRAAHTSSQPTAMGRPPSGVDASELKIWRYQHYRSHAPFGQKKALVIASLRKVHKMASDREQLFHSAIDKLREFVNLSYPLNLLRSACNLLAYTSAERTWLAVRNSIDNIDTTRLRA